MEASTGTPKVDLETYGPKIKQLQEDGARSAVAASSRGETSQAFLDQAAPGGAGGDEDRPLVVLTIPVTPGTGAAPKATDTVTVNYEGRLTDGTVFDSSMQHGGPATVPLNGVIKCWTEAAPRRQGGRQEPARLPRRPLRSGDEGCVRHSSSRRDPRLRGRAAGDLPAIGSDRAAV